MMSEYMGPGVAARSESNAHSNSTDGVFGMKPMVFSYASPQLVKLAKLEAMQQKLQKRMKEISDRPDERSFETHESMIDSGRAAMPRSTQQAQRGGIEQFQALIIPPEMSVNGNERDCTSRFVSLGRQQDYQRVQAQGDVGGNAGNVQVRYQAVEDALVEEMPARTKRGAKALALSDRKRDVPPPVVKDSAKDQLSRSLSVSFVPVKIDKNAMPQKALSSSAHVYEAVRSEVDRLLLLPLRLRAGVVPIAGPGGKPWNGFVDCNPALAKAIEEDLTGKSIKPAVAEGGTNNDAVAAHSHAGAAAVTTLALANEDAAVAPGYAASLGNIGIKPAMPGLRPEQQKPQQQRVRAQSDNGVPRGVLLVSSGGTEPPKMSQNASPSASSMHKGQEPLKPPAAKPPVSAARRKAPRGLEGHRTQPSASPVGRAGHSGAPHWPQSAGCRTGQGAGYVSDCSVGRSLHGGVKAQRPASAIPAARGSEAAGAPCNRSTPLMGTGELPSGYAPVSVWERLHSSSSATVPTAKTMARGRSGRLFEATSPGGGHFSCPTPRVEDIESAAMLNKRDDLQYRVLEFRARQVYNTCFGDKLSGARDTKETAEALARTAHATRPSSAPVFQSSMMASLAAGAASMHPPNPLPPRPYSAMPNAARSATLPRPASAARVGLASSVVRPYSALLCSATGVPSHRLRPPSAGQWAGRPVQAALVQEEEQEDMMMVAEGDWDYGTTAGGNIGSLT